MRILGAVLMAMLSVTGSPGSRLAEGAPAGMAPGRTLLASSGGSVARLYRSPLPGGLRVLTPFDPPSDRYGAGHLGVDLAAVPSASVVAAAAGVVRFAGSVAGRGVVVLQHPDGLSTEYEPVSSAVRAGQQVVRGALIGHVLGSHRACVPRRCLHWGARRGVDYLDPLSLLRPLGPVRLLPWDPAGTGGRGG